MIRRLIFTLTMCALTMGLASARPTSLPQTTSGDTTTYYLDGKVISSAYLSKLDAKTFLSVDVNKEVGTVRISTGKATESAQSRSYESKGTKIDWATARALQEVSFVVDDRVTDAQKARLLSGEQIESVYRLPPSGTGPNGETGSFGKNGLVIVTTKKK